MTDEFADPRPRLTPQVFQRDAAVAQVMRAPQRHTRCLACSPDGRAQAIRAEAREHLSAEVAILARDEGCNGREYPTACSPQAWSTGTPLLLLRTMLGLEPEGEHLVVDPALPLSIGQLALLDIPGRWGRIDAFGRGRVDVRRKVPAD